MTQAWNFISEPELHPMKVTVTVNEEKKTDSAKFIFVSPYTIYGEIMAGQTGSLMMDTFGNPVWFRPLNSIYEQNTDFKVQLYKGKPVLTMWQGTISGTQSATPNLPDGDAEPGAFYIIMNENYKIIKKLKAHNGFTSDLHEFTTTKNDTALFTSLKQVPRNLLRYGGPVNGYIDNYEIQEVDIETNKLLFTWDVLDHVDPADSMVPASSASTTNNIWDCYHVNSIDLDTNGNMLISMRNMWAVYSINKSGEILWQLGGKQSNFTFGKNAGFSWQHHARYRNHNKISVFDDACCETSTSSPQGQSRGLVLNLNFRTLVAKINKAYYHDPALYVPSQGDAQKLSNGNYFIGWGQKPYVSEFSRTGNTKINSTSDLLYEMQFPSKNISYRSFKVDWVGKPYYSPSIAVTRSHKCSIVYASWNGSTETVTWDVLAGSHKNELCVVTTSPRIGFETKIKINSLGPYFQVNALNSSGKVIGTSCVYRVNKE